MELRSGHKTIITMVDMGASTTQQCLPPPRNPVKHRQRELQSFSGSPDVDVRDWLMQYDHVSNRNRWGDSHILSNVVFVLRETTLLWSDNHEKDINSWDGFTVAFSEAFGKPKSRKQQTKYKPPHRCEATTESIQATAKVFIVFEDGSLSK